MCKSKLTNSVHRKGFVALSTVLILSVVMLAIVGTVTYTAIGEGQVALSLQQGEAGLNLVEGCTEDLLQKVHDDSAFSGTSVTRPEGTCTYSYTSSGPTNWDVTVSTNYTNEPRRIRVVFTRGANVTLTSWQEI